MRVAIHVKPGSARTAVGGRHGEGDALVVSVTARAVQGKATEAALRAVAEAFEVRRQDVSLVAGAASRDKVVEIEGEAAGLAGRREALLGPGADAGQAAVVSDNPAKSRYELHVGGELAGFVVYRLRSAGSAGVIDLLHTEVDPKFQGEGLAGQLAKASLDDARARHLAVLPTCPYIRSWIGRHPGYADLVAQRGRARPAD